MRKFKRNKETGILEVWDGDKKVGEVRTMGDEIMGNESTDDIKRRRPKNED